MEKHSNLIFFVNGRKVSEANPDTESTLLQYLRRKLLLPGTKEGCGHGGCGSCTVMVSKFLPDMDKVIHYTVNACLFPLCAVHGLAVTTVEGVGNPNTGLHDVQKRLVMNHALQCGFCTPGFVMSAFALLRNNPCPSRDDVERAFEGNLCRCTGYRPILDAFDSLTKEGCPMGDQCCKNFQTSKPNIQENMNMNDLPTDLDSTQVPIFPPELQTNEEYRKSVFFKGSVWNWIAPISLQELLELKSKFPQAPVIMGNTTAALSMKLGKFNCSPVLLYGGNIPTIKSVDIVDGGLEFGAAVTLSDLKEKLSTLEDKIGGDWTEKFQTLYDMIVRYGADQIRNVSTLSGSILCGRSNSDVLTLFIALNASVCLARITGERKVPIENMCPEDDEIIKSVFIPISKKGTYCAFYKQSDRPTFSLANVNCGMLVQLSDNRAINTLRICVGGLADKPLLLKKTMDSVVGRKWEDPLLNDVISSLLEELQPLSCMPEDAKYKMDVVFAFFFKFYNHVNESLGKSSRCSLSSMKIEACVSTQFYDPCTDPDQPESDAVGRPVPNVSSEAVVSGEAVYIDDMPKMEGELFLSLVLSKRARAKIIKIDPSEALNLDGVYGYIDKRDIPGVNSWNGEEIFASEEVLTIGQPIAAVLAVTREVAKKASSLVKVEYEDLPTILTIEDAIAANSFYGSPIVLVEGDTSKGFQESDHIVSGEYKTGHQEHFYMEPQSAYAIPKVENNELEVYCGTQFVSLAQESICTALNLPQHKVNIKTRRLGGSFGGKETRIQIVNLPVAIAAHKYKCPVRCVLPREVDMAITGKRHPFLGKYKVGFTKTGKIKALIVKMYSLAGHSVDLSLLVMNQCVDHFDSAYKFDNVNVEGYTCNTNTPSNTALRGFGIPQGILITEDILFNIACTIGVSQEQVREVNLYKERDITPNGIMLENCTARDVWKQCMEQSRYLQRKEDIENFNRINKWKKKGIALTTEKFAVGFPPKFLNQGSALVNIYKDGTVLITHGGIEMGQGINTKMIQVASRALGIPMELIYINETSSEKLPNSTVTAGSMGTDLFAPAVLDACNKLIKRLEPLKMQNPQLPWKSLIQMAYFDRIQLYATGFSRINKDCDWDREKRQGKPCEYYSYGSACTEVEIDVLTGENQVVQSDIVFDVGKSLNPAIDIGQIEGAFVQGLGMVTTEDINVDSTGKMQNCSPLSYKIPNVRSIPRKFNVTLLKNHSYTTTVYSSKACSEPPLILSMSVISAIKHAVQAARSQIGLNGYFELDSPATVERIHAACGNQLKNLSCN